MKIESAPGFQVEPRAIEAIVGHRKLIDHMGYWPSFHDSEVIRLMFDRVERSPSVHNDLCAEFYTFDLSKAPYDRERKQCLVEFLFSDIAGLELREWNHQNQINGMSINYLDDKFKVSWTGETGHQIDFICRAICVVRVRMLNPFIEPQDW